MGCLVVFFWIQAGLKFVQRHARAPASTVMYIDDKTIAGDIAPQFSLLIKPLGPPGVIKQIWLKKWPRLKPQVPVLGSNRILVLVFSPVLALTVIPEAIRSGRAPA